MVTSENGAGLAVSYRPSAAAIFIGCCWNMIWACSWPFKITDHDRVVPTMMPIWTSPPQEVDCWLRIRWQG